MYGKQRVRISHFENIENMRLWKVEYIYINTLFFKVASNFYTFNILVKTDRAEVNNTTVNTSSKDIQTLPSNIVNKKASLYRNKVGEISS